MKDRMEFPDIGVEGESAKVVHDGKRQRPLTKPAGGLNVYASKAYFGL